MRRIQKREEETKIYEVPIFSRRRSPSHRVAFPSFFSVPSLCFYGSMLMLLYLFAVSRFPGKWEDRDNERTKDVAWEEEGDRDQGPYPLLTP